MENLVRITRITRESFYQDLVELNEKKKQGILEPQLPLLELSKYLSERVVTPADRPPPECTACGVCCAFALMVPVTMADSERLSDIVEITFDSEHPDIAVDRVLSRSRENGHCINLQGNLGEEIGCRIYEDRPSVCREFEAGSDRCHEYRRIYGIEPQLTDAEIHSALKRIAGVKKRDVISEVQFVKGATVTSFGYSVGDEESWTSGNSLRLKVFIRLDDEEPHELHEFDPAEETWLESDFLALTMDEAGRMIAAKVGQG